MTDYSCKCGGNFKDSWFCDKCGERFKLQVKEAHEFVSEMDASMEKCWVGDGDTVKEGDTIITLNCMKMYFHYQTPISGIVHYNFAEGDYVKEGDILARVE